MLRNVLMALGLLCLLGAAAAAALGLYPAVFWLLLNGLVLSAGIAWERWRYRKPETAAPGAGWTRTGERFVDPESGRLTEVHYHAASGERRYVVRD